jgi:hypothetical protein
MASTTAARTIEAQPLALQAELDEPVAEKLANAGAELVALAGAALQAGKQRAVLRQCLGVVEQAGAATISCAILLSLFRQECRSPASSTAAPAPQAATLPRRRAAR